MVEKVSREHVEEVLARVGLATDARKDLLSRIDYPADIDEVARVLGLTHDDLLNRMGGSP
jgi:hypothetical protein